jgi:hypothetical protein
MMVIIRFQKEDEAKGFYTLALHGAVTGLRGGLFGIDEQLLKYLDRERIPYETLTEDFLLYLN